jgi:basic membrane protein A
VEASLTISTTKKAVVASGAAALLFILAACGAAPTPAPTSAGPTVTPVDFTACAVSDEGSWNDKSFNEAAFDGLKKAEAELGVKIQGFESKGPEDFGPNLTAALGADCDITFAVGFNFSWEGSLHTTLRANPDEKYAWIDGWSEGDANLKAIEYAMAESSFLAGYLAADYSKTKVLATYGGQDIPAVTDFMIGFRNGALQWAKDNGTSVNVLPDQFVGDFANTAVAQSISANFLAAGADVIFPVAGGLFTATDAAIKEAGADAVYLGVDKDIALTQPELADLVLTSVEKRMTQAVFDVIKELVDGKAFTNTSYVGTLANDGTSLSDFYGFDDKISAAVKTKIAELTADIIAGKIDPKVAP